jgi:hypothetical protein
MACVVNFSHLRARRITFIAQYKIKIFFVCKVPELFLLVKLNSFLMSDICICKVSPCKEYSSVQIYCYFFFFFFFFFAKFAKFMPHGVW